jgi:hypothetical protein
LHAQQTLLTMGTLLVLAQRRVLREPFVQLDHDSNNPLPGIARVPPPQKLPFL